MLVVQPVGDSKHPDPVRVQLEDAADDCRLRYVDRSSDARSAAHILVPIDLPARDLERLGLAEHVVGVLVGSQIVLGPDRLGVTGEAFIEPDVCPVAAGEQVAPPLLSLTPCTYPSAVAYTTVPLLATAGGVSARCPAEAPPA